MYLVCRLLLEKQSVPALRSSQVGSTFLQLNKGWGAWVHCCVVHSPSPQYLCCPYRRSLLNQQSSQLVWRECQLPIGSRNRSNGEGCFICESWLRGAR